MIKIPKIVDGETRFKESDINNILTSVENALNSLKVTIDESVLKNQRIVLFEQPIRDSVPEWRVVFFNGSKWDSIDGLNPIGEVLQNFPIGVAADITGITNQKKATIYLFGYITGVDESIIETGEQVQIGVPYFLSPNEVGKITSKQPEASVYVGVFISTSIFLLNFQFMTTSHIHRRTLLDPSKWVDNSPSYILYPVEELSQLPLPFKGVVLTIDSDFLPKYGPYIVDVEGIKLVDQPFFESLLGLGSGGLFAHVSDPSRDIEVFWSDPRTLTTPGVLTLKAGTTNLEVKNQIPSQPDDVGSLVISNIPKLEVSTENSALISAIKDVQVDQDGKIKLFRGPIVEAIKAGSNVTVDRNQGVVTVNAVSGVVTELEFTDVFLRGSLSKIIPNTILTYVEYPHTRQISTIYKLQLPPSLDISKSVEVFITYFGLQNVEDTVVVPINVRHTIMAPSKSVSEPPVFSLAELEVEEGQRPVRKLLKQISASELRENATLSVQVERPVDNVYAAPVGVLSLTCRFRST